MERNELERLRSWLAGYCRSFYGGGEADDRNITLKELHTARVCTNILPIARGEGVDENSLLLAETIALFHDIGRFPQYQRYKTFRDSISVNHAALGGEVLRQEKVLDKLPRHEQDIVIRSVCDVVPTSLTVRPTSRGTSCRRVTSTSGSSGIGSEATMGIDSRSRRDS